MGTNTTENSIAAASRLLPDGLIDQLREGTDARIALGRIDPGRFGRSALPALSSERYTRFEIHNDADVMVVLIVWLPGQFSVPHDHGGSSCHLRVLSGIATEQRFEVEADGRVSIVDEDRFLAGSIVSCDGNDIHAMGNDRDSSEELITLHVYRPNPVMREYIPVANGSQ